MKMLIAVLFGCLVMLSESAFAGEKSKLVKDYRYRVDSTGDMILEGVVDDKYNGKPIQVACYDDTSKKYLGNGDSFVRGGTFKIYISDVKREPDTVSCNFSVG